MITNMKIQDLETVSVLLKQSANVRKDIDRTSQEIAYRTLMKEQSEAELQEIKAKLATYNINIDLIHKK